LGGLGIQRPIVCSDPLVEPVLLKSGQGHYVAFVNHAPGQPRRLRCTVALPDQWQAQEIWPDQRPLGAGHEIDLGVMRTKFVLIELRTAQGH
ncbi:MAG: hypothetical protein H5T86_15890, partial [Armatimonadetes bacterium]|nr:hypothetical protein [Armatimonadota bacterium]